MHWGQALNPFFHLATNQLNLPKCLILLIAVHCSLGNTEPQPGQDPVTWGGPVVKPSIPVLQLATKELSLALPSPEQK